MVLLNIMRRGCGMDELDWIGWEERGRKDTWPCSAVITIYYVSR